MGFPVNDTDAVHVYTNETQIWLQLRRDVPTKKAISEPSFKLALSLTASQAIAIAGELMTAASQALTLPPKTRPWSAAEDEKLLHAHAARMPLTQIAEHRKRSLQEITARLAKLGKRANLPPSA